MSDDKISEIRKRYEDYRGQLGGGWQAHYDRGWLLAEVERLRAVAESLLVTLMAAHSLLRAADDRADGNVREVVSSNSMLRAMLDDYRKSIERASKLLKEDGR